MTISSKYGQTVNFNFAAGASQSNAVNLQSPVDANGVELNHELRAIGFLIPSGWTTAALTLLASFDDGLTFQSIYDATGTEYQMTVVAGGYCLLLPADLIGLHRIKLQSGTTASPVNQVSAVTIKANVRRFE